MEEPHAPPPALVSSVCRAMVMKMEEAFKLIPQAQFFFLASME